MLSVPMSGYLGMDLPRFLALLRARWRLIAVILLSAVLLAIALSLAQPDRYQASADLLFGRTTNADAIVAGGTTDTREIPERAAATNLALASLDTVAARVARRFDGVTVGELEDAVSIEAAGDSDVVTVTAEWDSPRDAAAVANAFASEIAAFRRETARREIQRAIDALRTTLPAPSDAAPEPSEATRAVQERLSELEALKAIPPDVQVAEQATPPESRSSPRPLRNALIAALVALVLAVFVVILLARFDDRVREEDELTALMDLSVLTRIPWVGLPDRLRRAGPGHEEPAFLEAFEFLRLNLELLGPDGESVVVAVTSPAADDGKTTVVAGLANSLSASGADVVAVDLDLRKPDLHRYFDLQHVPETGVLDALLESGYAANGSAASQSQPTEVESGGSTELEPEEELGLTRARRVHTQEDVETGLVALARSKGHVRRAARSLKASGHNIPESTLRRWKDVHADLYERIRAERRHGIVAGPHLRLLAGDSHPQLSTGLVARGRLQHLFDDLRQQADYVVVDTVPISTVADASAVAAAADGVLLVVDLNQARRRDLLAAKKQLANARAKVFGMVVNRAAVDLPAYRPHEEDGKSERGLGF
jgi:Mrp family chromosome partitioning ATPase